MHRHRVAATLAVALIIFGTPPPSAGQDEHRLTLGGLLAIVDARHPAIASARAAASGAAGAVTQAGLFPNPELQLESEDMAGSGGYRGLGASQWTLSLSQQIPLGGDLGAAVDQARAEQQVALATQSEVRLRARQDAVLAFADAWSAQSQVAALAQLRGAVNQGIASVERRAAAGSASDADVARIRIEAAQIDLATVRAESTGAAALARLRAILKLPLELEVSLAPLVAPVIPGETALAQQIAEAPAARRAFAAREAAVASEQRAKATAIPDLNVAIGGRTYRETKDSAIVAQIGIPIPVFDRGQGARPQTRALAQAARWDALAVTAELQARAAEIAARGRALAAELQRLREDILPQAERAFASAQALFERGRFGALEVVDAQRTLQEARLREIEAAADLLRAAAELETVTGTELLAPVSATSSTTTP